MTVPAPVRLILILLTVLGASLAAPGAPASAALVDPDFRDDAVTSVAQPTAVAFTPDGRMLITTQSGRLRVFKDGALLAAPALDLSAAICSNSERGLLGVAVDPSFAANRAIYLYYTFNKHNSCVTGQPTNPSNPVNRVSRFTLSPDSVAGGEVVLVDNMVSANGNHNGGDLHFGKDGYLYVSVGDGGADYAGNSGGGGSNDAARDQHVLLGKILRITRDGGVPLDNPFLGVDSARCNVTGRTDAGKKCQETFAWGLRNPFRLAFDPNAAGTRFFINDVGQNEWEEIDEGVKGADYGWNICEGTYRTGSASQKCSPPPGAVPPVYEYAHGSCNSITGGAFVPNGLWPARYNGAYLYADYVCGKIFALTPKAGGGFTQSEFGNGLGPVIALDFGPHGTGKALYYTTYASGGQVRRVTLKNAGNNAPVAVAALVSGAATPDGKIGYVDLNQPVGFSAEGSYDPDNDVISYEWNFGDGQTATGRSVTHTYGAKQVYGVTLTARDAEGATTQASLTVHAGGPRPSIVAPTADKLYAVGETITLTGSATDRAGTPLDPSSGAVTFTWNVLINHNGDHTHPYVSNRVGNGLTFTAPPPEDLAAAEASNLWIRLLATDRDGVSGYATREIDPHRVDVSFETEPGGLQVQINGVLVDTPFTLVSWEGYRLDVRGVTQRDGSGEWLMPFAWSSGAGLAQTIVTPASEPAAYRARYKRANAWYLPVAR